jgi:hypothetical protein
MGTRNRLTVLFVRRVKAPGLYADGDNLALQVAPRRNGKGVTKSWIYRFKPPGAKKHRDHGLGPYPARSLADARQRRDATHRLRLDGKDPIEAKRAAERAAQLTVARTIMFADAAAQCIAAKALCRPRRWPSRRP